MFNIITIKRQFLIFKSLDIAPNKLILITN